LHLGFCRKSRIDAKWLAWRRFPGILSSQGVLQHVLDLSGGILPLVASPGRQLQPDEGPSQPEDRQRQRLILALVLFVAAIGVVIFKVATSAGGSQPEIDASQPPTEAAPVAGTASPAPGNSASPTNGEAALPTAAAPVITDLRPGSTAAKALHGKPKPAGASKPAPLVPENSAPPPTVTRKVLPPLAVEVFAGGRPVPLQSKPTVAVRVDTSNGIQGRAATPGQATAVASGNEPASAGRVKISAEALQVLSHPVDPNYPMLAREMKVQGSVILDAYIGRDGSIQALKIVSGPTILATAAMEAVRQWRFKPYLQAGQAVETEARITVNFTISTT
jgi:periplasmic protein TonB